MVNNPQLHYLNHVQNTSISKNCHKFSTAPRFPQSGNIKTQFKYDIKQKSQRRYCNFGYGNRSKSTNNDDNAPAPNHYNIVQRKSKYITIGLSRQRVKFGTIGVEIDKKAKIPAPGDYKLPQTIKHHNFTLKQKLPDQIEIKLKIKMPGPGYYNSECLNDSGKYVCSNNKNTRFIILDANKKQPSKYQPQVGPGSCKFVANVDDLFNRDSGFSRFKIQRMRKSSIKSFGTDARKGPQYRHKKFIPGPGLYETFSSFGKNYYQRHARSVTQEQ